MDTNNDFLKHRSSLFIVIGIILILVFFIVFVLNNQKSKNTVLEDQIKVNTTDGEITLNKNGLVEINKGNRSLQRLFDNAKTDELFNYLYKTKSNNNQESYKILLITNGETKTISVPSDNLLINELIDSAGGSSVNPTVTVINYFQPTPTSAGGSGGGGGGGAGGGSGGGGGTGGGSGGSGPGGDCLFWTLSWCFIFPSPTPTSTQVFPTPTGFIQKPADCDLYNQLVTKRTIISNTLCITDITPTP